MGNQSSSSKLSGISESDLQNLQLTDLFNDSFIDRISRETSKSATAVKKKAEDSSSTEGGRNNEISSKVEVKLKALLSLFYDMPGSTSSASVNMFPVLVDGLEDGSSPSRQSSVDNTQCFLHAFVKKISSNGGSNNGNYKKTGSSTADNMTGVVEFLSKSKSGSAESSSGETQSEILSATAIEMCLSLATSLGQENAQVFTTMADKLVAMFSSTTDSNSDVEAHRRRSASIWYQQSMQSIVQFARDAIANSPVTDTTGTGTGTSAESTTNRFSPPGTASSNSAALTIHTTALGLLVSIGVLTGSADTIIEAAALCDKNSIILSDSSRSMLRSVARAVAEQQLSKPSCGTAAAVVGASYLTSEAHKRARGSFAAPINMGAQGCDSSCSLSHEGNDICLMCEQRWGVHNGHNCPSGSANANSRGSFIKKGEKKQSPSELLELVKAGQTVAVAETAMSSTATDGVSMYVWDGAAGQVLKYGTGFHLSSSGDLICQTNDIFGQIQEFKKNTAAAAAATAGANYAKAALAGAADTLHMSNELSMAESKEEASLQESKEEANDNKLLSSVGESTCAAASVAVSADNSTSTVASAAAAHQSPVPPFSDNMKSPEIILENNGFLATVLNSDTYDSVLVTDLCYQLSTPMAAATTTNSNPPSLSTPERSIVHYFEVELVSAEVGAEVAIGLVNAAAFQLIASAPYDNTDLNTFMHSRKVIGGASSDQTPVSGWTVGDIFSCGMDSVTGEVHMHVNGVPVEQSLHVTSHSMLLPAVSMCGHSTGVICTGLNTGNDAFKFKDQMTCSVAAVRAGKTGGGVGAAASLETAGSSVVAPKYTAGSVVYLDNKVLLRLKDTTNGSDSPLSPREVAVLDSSSLILENIIELALPAVDERRAMSRSKGSHSNLASVTSPSPVPPTLLNNSSSSSINSCSKGPSAHGGSLYLSNAHRDVDYTFRVKRGDAVYICSNVKDAQIVVANAFLMNVDENESIPVAASAQVTGGDTSSSVAELDNRPQEANREDDEDEDDDDDDEDEEEDDDEEYLDYVTGDDSDADHDEYSRDRRDTILARQECRDRDRARQTGASARSTGTSSSSSVPDHASSWANNPVVRRPEDAEKDRNVTSQVDQLLSKDKTVLSFNFDPLTILHHAGWENAELVIVCRISGLVAQPLDDQLLLPICSDGNQMLYFSRVRTPLKQLLSGNSADMDEPSGQFLATPYLFNALDAKVTFDSDVSPPSTHSSAALTREWRLYVMAKIRSTEFKPSLACHGKEMVLRVNCGKHECCATFSESGGILWNELFRRTSKPSLSTLLVTRVSVVEGEMQYGNTTTLELPAHFSMDFSNSSDLSCNHASPCQYSMCNGNKMMIGQLDMTKPQTAMSRTLKLFTFALPSGQLLASSEETYVAFDSKKAENKVTPSGSSSSSSSSAAALSDANRYPRFGIPAAFTFDTRNNLVWSWDIVGVSKACFRYWHNSFKNSPVIHVSRDPAAQIIHLCGEIDKRVVSADAAKTVTTTTTTTSDTTAASKSETVLAAAADTTNAQVILAAKESALLYAVAEKLLIGNKPADYDTPTAFPDIASELLCRCNYNPNTTKGSIDIIVRGISVLRNSYSAVSHATYGLAVLDGETYDVLATRVVGNDRSMSSNTLGDSVNSFLSNNVPVGAVVLCVALLVGGARHTQSFPTIFDDFCVRPTFRSDQTTCMFMLVGRKGCAPESSFTKLVPCTATDNSEIKADLRAMIPAASTIVIMNNNNTSGSSSGGGAFKAAKHSFELLFAGCERYHAAVSASWDQGLPASAEDKARLLSCIRILTTKISMLAEAKDFALAEERASAASSTTSNKRSIREKEHKHGFDVSFIAQLKGCLFLLGESQLVAKDAMLNTATLNLYAISLDIIHDNFNDEKRVFTELVDKYKSGILSPTGKSILQLQMNHMFRVPSTSSVSRQSRLKGMSVSLNTTQKQMDLLRTVNAVFEKETVLIIRQQLSAKTLVAVDGKRLRDTAALAVQFVCQFILADISKQLSRSGGDSAVSLTAAGIAVDTLKTVLTQCLDSVQAVVKILKESYSSLADSDSGTVEVKDTPMTPLTPATIAATEESKDSQSSNERDSSPLLLQQVTSPASPPKPLAAATATAIGGTAGGSPIRTLSASEQQQLESVVTSSLKSSHGALLFFLSKVTVLLVQFMKKCFAATSTASSAAQPLTVELQQKRELNNKVVPLIALLSKYQQCFSFCCSLLPVSLLHSTVDRADSSASGEGSGSDSSSSSNNNSNHGDNSGGSSSVAKTGTSLISTATSSFHWLIKLDTEITAALCSLGSLFVMAVPTNQFIESAPTVMWADNTRVVKPELYTGVLGDSTEDIFLQELITRPSQSLATAFVRIMRPRVRLDQGSVDAINRAVYGTCAVLIKYNNLTQEAMAVASGSKPASEVSDALLKAWETGNTEVRAYFRIKLSEAKVSSSFSRNVSSSAVSAGATLDAEVPSPLRTASGAGSGAGTGTGSAESALRDNLRSAFARTSSGGSSESRLTDKFSSRLLERICFLLRSPRRDEDSHGHDGASLGSPLLTSLSRANGSSSSSSESASMLGLNPYPLSRQTSYENAASSTADTDSSDVSDVKIRWQLAAKLLAARGRALRSGNKSWFQVVDHIVTKDKLRASLVNRRKYLARLGKRGERTLSQKIVDFIKCEAIKIDTLEQLGNIRSERATWRAAGLHVFRNCFATLCSHNTPFSFTVLTDTYVSVMKQANASLPSNEDIGRRNAKGKKDTSASVEEKTAGNGESDESELALVHHLNSVTGSSPTSSDLLSKRYASFFSTCVRAMEKCLSEYVALPVAAQHMQLKRAWGKALVGCMQASALDFRVTELETLHNSRFLDTLRRILLLAVTHTTNSCSSSNSNSSSSTNNSGDVENAAAAEEEENEIDGVLSATATATALSINDAAEALLEVVVGRSLEPDSTSLSAPKQKDLSIQSKFRAAVVDMMAWKLQLSSRRLIVQEDATTGNNISGSAKEATLLCSSPSSPLPFGNSSSSTKVSNATTAEISVISGTRYIERGLTGCSYPDFDLFGSKGKEKEKRALTLCFWIRRPRSSILDLYNSADKKYQLVSKDSKTTLKKGEIVMRGPDWKNSFSKVVSSAREEDGGLGNLGVVTEYLPSVRKAKVLWQSAGIASMSTKEYVTNTDPAARGPSGGFGSSGTGALIPVTQEVTRADPAMRGQIFTKGVISVGSAAASSVTAAAASSLGSATTTLPNHAWNTFSIDMYPDATIGLSVCNSNFPENINVVRAKNSLPPETWVHMTIVIEDKTCKIYEDGVLVSSAVFNEDLPREYSGPLFVGQPPMYCHRSAHTTSGQTVDCAVANFSVFPCQALSDEEVAARTRETHLVFSTTSGIGSSSAMTRKYSSVSQVSMLDNDKDVGMPVLSALQTLRRGLEGIAKLGDVAVQRGLGNANLLETLFSIMCNGTDLLRSACYQLCAHALPLIDRHLVETHASRSPLFASFSTATASSSSSPSLQGPSAVPPSCSTFMEYLIISIGRNVNVWGQLSFSSSAPASTKEALIRSSGEAAYSVAMSQVALLKALAMSSHHDWSVAAAELISGIVSKASDAVNKLSLVSKIEAFSADTVDMGEAAKARAIAEAKDTNTTAELDKLYGLLSLLGGEFPVLREGASAVYLDVLTGMTEECVVLGSTAIPTITSDDMATYKEGSRSFGSSSVGSVEMSQKAKEYDALWSNASGAVAVMFKTQPGEFTVVPRENITIVSDVHKSSSVGGGGGGSGVESALSQFHLAEAATAAANAVNSEKRSSDSAGTGTGTGASALSSISERTQSSGTDCSSPMPAPPTTTGSEGGGGGLRSISTHSVFAAAADTAFEKNIYSFLRFAIGEEGIVHLFSLLADLDVVDRRPVPVDHTVVTTCSQLQYPTMSSPTLSPGATSPIYETITCPDASVLVVEFDEQTDAGENGRFVKLYTNATLLEQYPLRRNQKESLRFPIIDGGGEGRQDDSNNYEDPENEGGKSSSFFAVIPTNNFVFCYDPADSAPVDVLSYEGYSVAAQSKSASSAAEETTAVAAAKPIPFSAGAPAGVACPRSGCGNKLIPIVNNSRNDWACDCKEHLGSNGYSRDKPGYTCPTMRACNYDLCANCYNAQNKYIKFETTAPVDEDMKVLAVDVFNSNSYGSFTNSGEINFTGRYEFEKVRGNYAVYVKPNTGMHIMFDENEEKWTILDLSSSGLWTPDFSSSNKYILITDSLDAVSQASGPVGTVYLPKINGSVWKKAESNNRLSCTMLILDSNRSSAGLMSSGLGPASKVSVAHAGVVSGSTETIGSSGSQAKISKLMKNRYIVNSKEKRSESPSYSLDAAVAEETSESAEAKKKLVFGSGKYKFTVTALKSSRVYATESAAPPVCLSKLAHLKMLSFKAFTSALTNSKSFAYPSVKLFRSLVSAALAPVPQLGSHSERVKKGRAVTRRTMLESSHPYRLNMTDFRDEDGFIVSYIPVLMPLCNGMHLCFDPRSHLDESCESISIIGKDGVLLTMTGKATGGGAGTTSGSGTPNSGTPGRRLSGANTKRATSGLGPGFGAPAWPGVGNTPPLQIPGDFCKLRIRSKMNRAIHWGWRCLVTDIDAPSMAEEAAVHNASAIAGVTGLQIEATAVLSNSFYLQQFLQDYLVGKSIVSEGVSLSSAASSSECFSLPPVTASASYIPLPDSMTTAVRSHIGTTADGPSNSGMNSKRPSTADVMSMSTGETSPSRSPLPGSSSFSGLGKSSATGANGMTVDEEEEAFHVVLPDRRLSVLKLTAKAQLPLKLYSEPTADEKFVTHVIPPENAEKVRFQLLKQKNNYIKVEQIVNGNETTTTTTSSSSSAVIGWMLQRQGSAVYVQRAREERNLFNILPPKAPKSAQNVAPMLEFVAVPDNYDQLRTQQQSQHVLSNPASSLQQPQQQQQPVFGSASNAGAASSAFGASASADFGGVAGHSAELGFQMPLGVGSHPAYAVLDNGGSISGSNIRNRDSNGSNGSSSRGGGGSDVGLVATNVTSYAMSRLQSNFVCLPAQLIARELRTGVEESVTSLRKALYSLSIAGVASYAVRCVSALVQCWPQGVPLNEDFFGGTSELLSFMNILLQAESVVYGQQQQQSTGTVGTATPAVVGTVPGGSGNINMFGAEDLLTVRRFISLLSKHATTCYAASSADLTTTSKNFVKQSNNTTQLLSFAKSTLEVSVPEVGTDDDHNDDDGGGDRSDKKSQGQEKVWARALTYHAPFSTSSPTTSAAAPLVGSAASMLNIAGGTGTTGGPLKGQKKVFEATQSVLTRAGKRGHVFDINFPGASEIHLICDSGNPHDEKGHIFTIRRADDVLFQQSFSRTVKSRPGCGSEPKIVVKTDHVYVSVPSMVTYFKLYAFGIFSESAILAISTEAAQKSAAATAAATATATSTSTTAGSFPKDAGEKPVVEQSKDDVLSYSTKDKAMKKTSKKKSRKRRQQAVTPQALTLSFTMLTSFLSSANASEYFADIYTVRVLRSLRWYMNQVLCASDKRKLEELVQLFLGHLVEGVQPKDIYLFVTELLSLRQELVSLANKFPCSDIIAGTSTTMISLMSPPPQVQSIIQLVLSLDAVLKSIEMRFNIHTSVSNSLQCESGTAATNAATNLPRCYGVGDTIITTTTSPSLLAVSAFGCSTTSVSPDGCIRRWSVELTRIADTKSPPVVGLLKRSLAGDGSTGGREEERVWLGKIGLAAPVTAMGNVFSTTSAAGADDDDDEAFDDYVERTYLVGERADGSSFQVGWNGLKLFAFGQCEIPFGGSTYFAVGDIVTVELDVELGCVSFYKNGVFVGTAIGPEGTGAALVTDMLLPSEFDTTIDSTTKVHSAASCVESISPAVSLLHVQDCVTVKEPLRADDFVLPKGVSSVYIADYQQRTLKDVHVSLASVPSTSTTSSVKMHAVDRFNAQNVDILAADAVEHPQPSWLEPLTKCQSILNSYNQHDIPYHVLKQELIPICEDHAAGRIEITDADVMLAAVSTKTTSSTEESGSIAVKASSSTTNTNTATVSITREVNVPRASSFNIMLNSMRLRDGEKLEVFDELGARVLYMEAQHVTDTPDDAAVAAAAPSATVPTTASSSSTSSSSSSTEIEVAGLPPTLSNSDIMKLLANHGSIDELRTSVNPFNANMVKFLCKFATYEEAAAATQALNALEYNGSTLAVRHIGTSPAATSTTAALAIDDEKAVGGPFQMVAAASSTATGGGFKFAAADNPFAFGKTAAASSSVAPSTSGLGSFNFGASAAATTTAAAPTTTSSPFGAAPATSAPLFGAPTAFGVSATASAVVKCPFNHNMDMSTYNSGEYNFGWKCKMCQKSGVGRRWFCNVDSYDICFQCRPQPPVTGGGFSTFGAPLGGGAGIGAGAGAGGIALCGQGHAMTISTATLTSSTGTLSSGWDCDQCGATGRGERWYCAIDQAEFCFACKPREGAAAGSSYGPGGGLPTAGAPLPTVSGAAPTCSKAHKCVISSTSAGAYSGGWVCNSCSKSGRGERWHCADCQYDCCFSCKPRVSVSTTTASPVAVSASTAVEVSSSKILSSPMSPLSTDTLQLGDSVVRGPSWEWGDEDGGAGCIGTVTGFFDWGAERSNSPQQKGSAFEAVATKARASSVATASKAVSVRWNTSGYKSVYRAGHDGLFDVVPVDKSITLGRAQQKHGASSFKITGSGFTVKVSVVVVDAANDSSLNDGANIGEEMATGVAAAAAAALLSREVVLSYKPELSIHTCLSEPMFSKYVAHYRNLYLGSAPASLVNTTSAVSTTATNAAATGSSAAASPMQRLACDVALVEYINKQVMKNSTSLSLYMASTDSLVKPSDADFSKSSALKALYDFTALMKGDDFPRLTSLGKHYTLSLPIVSTQLPSTRTTSDSIPIDANSMDSGAAASTLFLPASTSTSISTVWEKDPITGRRKKKIIKKKAAPVATHANASQPTPFAAIASTGIKSASTSSSSKSTTFVPLCGKCKVSPLVKEVVVVRAGHEIGGCCWADHNGPTAFIVGQQRYVCFTKDQCQWYLCEFCHDNYALKKAAEEETAASGTGIGSALGNGSSTFSQSGAKREVETNPLKCRHELVRQLNMAFVYAVSFVDLSISPVYPSSMVDLFSKYRGLVFSELKQSGFAMALDRSSSSSTSSRGGQFTLDISRSRASKFYHVQPSISDGGGGGVTAKQYRTDHDGRYAIFSQAFRKMHSMPAADLRSSGQLYTVRLMGEQAVDAGGPYRESFSMYAQELQSAALPLMLPTANSKNEIGVNRDRWVLNPAATSATNIEMYAFFGKLMGIAIRSKEFLALNIPSLIWKLLVSDQPTIEDLEGIDYFTVTKKLATLRDCKDEDEFELTFEGTTFTVETSSEKTIELIPNGANTVVSFDRRHEYYDLYIQYRLHEFDVQAEAIKKGLATIVPLHLLKLFTWHQLERMVCGDIYVNVDLLQSATTYSGCNSTDQHVQFFWRAMREFTDEERAAVIQFVWSRSRLPLTKEGFSQPFKIQSFHCSPPDSYYPVSHTCFFSLELPKYSTYEIMKEKLRYAAYNCREIDGDGGYGEGRNVAGLGWEE